MNQRSTSASDSP
ncbi:unnamed protein product, partial [Didymodactylos carnosus]